MVRSSQSLASTTMGVVVVMIAAIYRGGTTSASASTRSSSTTATHHHRSPPPTTAHHPPPPSPPPPPPPLPLSTRSAEPIHLSIELRPPPRFGKSCGEGAPEVALSVPYSVLSQNQVHGLAATALFATPSTIWASAHTRARGECVCDLLARRRRDGLSMIYSSPLAWAKCSDPVCAPTWQALEQGVASKPMALALDALHASRVIVVEPSIARGGPWVRPTMVHEERHTNPWVSSMTLAALLAYAASQ